MEFSMLLVVIDEELETEAIDVAKENGAGGVTIMKGSGIGLNEKTTFFGLVYERSESVLMFILEKNIGKKVMKALDERLNLEEKGIIISMPIESIAGITQNQLENFEKQLEGDA